MTILAIASWDTPITWMRTRNRCSKRSIYTLQGHLRPPSTLDFPDTVANLWLIYLIRSRFERLHLRTAYWCRRCVNTPAPTDMRTTGISYISAAARWAAPD